MVHFLKHSIKLPKTIKNKLNQVSRVCDTTGYPYSLYIEGSYATGKANSHSDIDLCLVVPKKLYNSSRLRIGESLKKLKGVVRVLDFGEEMGYPGYHYCYIIFKMLGPYKLFDICIMPNGKKSYRGKQVLYSVSTNSRTLHRLNKKTSKNP